MTPSPTQGLGAFPAPDNYLMEGACKGCAPKGNFVLIMVVKGALPKSNFFIVPGFEALQRVGQLMAEADSLFCKLGAIPEYNAENERIVGAMLKRVFGEAGEDRSKRDNMACTCPRRSDKCNTISWHFILCFSFKFSYVVCCRHRIGQQVG